MVLITELCVGENQGIGSATTHVGGLVLRRDAMQTLKRYGVLMQVGSLVSHRGDICVAPTIKLGIG